MIILRREIMNKQLAIMLIDMKMFERSYPFSTLRGLYRAAESGAEVAVSGIVKPNIGCCLLTHYNGTASMDVYIHPNERGKGEANAMVKQFSHDLGGVVPRITVKIQDPTTKLVRKHLLNWCDVDFDIIPSTQKGK